jgi:polyhydroxyalkanoate synthesis regulator protein
MPLSSAVLIKRHAGCRLYHTASAAYLTLDDLGRMIEDDVDFAVREAETGEDITPSIFRQIIRKRALHG